MPVSLCFSSRTSACRLPLPFGYKHEPYGGVTAKRLIERGRVKIQAALRGVKKNTIQRAVALCLMHATVSHKWDICLDIKSWPHIMPAVKSPFDARVMTVGMVQKESRAGMSQADVAIPLGPPNVVTKDGAGEEI